MRVVFESATGIICRGYPTDVNLQEGDPCAVLTYSPLTMRAAKARFGPVDSFTKLGELRGYPGDEDLLLEWQRDSDANPDDLQAVLIGGVTHYCAA